MNGCGFHQLVIPMESVGDFHRAVVIAMSVVRMVQVTVDQVVDVVAVRNGWMAAIRAVHMAGFVAAALVIGSATGWICLIDF